MSALSSNLDDFGNFATSSSVSHLVFSHSRPQPSRRHLDVYNRGETQDDWLLVGYNMGAVGARGRQSSKAFPLGSMATGKRHCWYSEMIIVP